MIKKALYQIKLWMKDIFIYHTKTISPEDSLDYDMYWEGKRGDEVGVLSDWQKERANIILKEIKNDSHKDSVSIADIGCGEGSILDYIKHYGNISESFGYDSSPFVLEKAKKIGIETHLLDLNNKESLKDIKRADYMLILEVLEHIPHSEEVLKLLLNKSDKGVFFSFPNTGFFTFRLRLLFGKFPKQWVTFPNEHIRFWTATDLKWWLNALGYTEHTIHYYRGIPLLNKIFPSLFAAAFVVYLPKE